MSSKPTQPLQDVLDSVLARLSALEEKAGITPATTTVSSGETEVVVDAPAVVAYDAYLETTIAPLAKTCNDIGKLENLGGLIQDAWGGIRIAVVLASRTKKPANLAADLQPHLKTVQQALESIRKLRLDRKYDWHIKAVLELAGSLSWVLIQPPPQTPSTFCKEAIASSTFWSNKIRKEYKAKDETQIAFCDGLKATGNNLVEYITQHHKTGLTFNPQGVATLAEAASSMEGKEEAPPAEAAPAKAVPKKAAGGGGASSLMAELQKKQTSDGASAATGLRKVTRDQQTWRKEFKGEKSSTVAAAPQKAPSAVPKKAAVATKPPLCEFQERGHKWVIENQTKESSDGISIDVSDPKQQVYVYNCQDITIQIKGDKVKSIVLDKCSRVALVFSTCISSCEVVNCKRIQVQTLGVCPTFTIDKTIGCLIYVSKETMEQSSFVASQSSEMNVSYPDGEEQKELPIPEQFVHKLVNGSISSEVSDLYH